MNFILVYITNPTKKAAKKIAGLLLKKKLIACVNIFPINSMYRWEGKIVDEKEFVSIVKTTKGNFERVKKEVEKHHPYKVPCIIKIPVISNRKFSNWLRNEVKK